MNKLENRFREFGPYTNQELIRDLKLLVDDLNERLGVINSRLEALEAAEGEDD